MTAAPSPDSEREEIAADARRERRLIPQAILALAVVAVIVVVRELLLR
ncbi:hypothetical protein [Microbacterium sp. MYb62]|nr:hypothetical protein [Microbacterium sp. MYb62]